MFGCGAKDVPLEPISIDRLHLVGLLEQALASARRREAIVEPELHGALLHWTLFLLLLVSPYWVLHLQLLY